jgi:hypothetical protein
MSRSALEGRKESLRASESPKPRLCLRVYKTTLKPWGQKSGGPAVRGIVAEIDPFCNGNLPHPQAHSGQACMNTMHA